MYVLSKESAKLILEKYNKGYFEKSVADRTMQHFASDWTITKDGERALVYPMLAVENSALQYIEDSAHADFHDACIKAQFEEGAFS